jgi:hypothetical protein
MLLHLQLQLSLNDSTQVASRSGRNRTMAPSRMSFYSLFQAVGWQSPNGTWQDSNLPCCSIHQLFKDSTCITVPDAMLHSILYSRCRLSIEVSEASSQQHRHKLHLTSSRGKVQVLLSGTILSSYSRRQQFGIQSNRTNTGFLMGTGDWGLKDRNFDFHYFLSHASVLR